MALKINLHIDAKGPVDLQLSLRTGAGSSSGRIEITDAAENNSINIPLPLQEGTITVPVTSGLVENPLPDEQAFVEELKNLRDSLVHSSRRAFEDLAPRSDAVFVGQQPDWLRSEFEEKQRRLRSLDHYRGLLREKQREPYTVYFYSQGFELVEQLFSETANIHDFQTVRARPIVPLAAFTVKFVRPDLLERMRNFETQYLRQIPVTVDSAAWLFPAYEYRLIAAQNNPKTGIYRCTLLVKTICNVNGEYWAGVSLCPAESRRRKPAKPIEEQFVTALIETVPEALVRPYFKTPAGDRKTPESPTSIQRPSMMLRLLSKLYTK